MPVERAAGGTSLMDVLDRVLDKGIVIDAWVRVSLVGIDLITVEARVVVASIDTYLTYSEAVAQVAPISRPAGEITSRDVLAENAALRAELAASKSALPRQPYTGRLADDDDDDDDGGEGSSGAPAILERPMEPRRRPPSRPERTRRPIK